jgi:flagellar basal body-associated protein FliL
MLEWIIQISIISLILIILIHYLFTFFKTNLTIPKVKDLVDKPQKQYEILFNTMKETDSNFKNKNDTIIDKKIDTNIDSENMKNELKNYLKELSGNKTPNNNNNNNNAGLLTGENVMNSSFSSNNYSTF